MARFEIAPRNDIADDRGDKDLMVMAMVSPWWISLMV